MPEPITAARPAPVIVEPEPSAPADGERSVRAALEAAVESLLSKARDDDGRGWRGLHFCAELEGDSILSSEYLLMKAILGQLDGPDRPRLVRIANHLRLTQRADGTWGQYPGSGPDLSAMVKAYVCLKLFGDSPDAPHMARARARIRELGGAEKINTFSMFYLACLGLVPWTACPAIPPEIALFPRWFPFHMDKVSAWTRTMILPLAICSALRPVTPLPPAQRCDELFVDLRAARRLNRRWSWRRPVSFHNFFLLADRVLKLAQGLGVTPLRRRALAEAERWILERVDPATTEGLGAIFPPMVYLQIAFRALGYPREHPVLQEAERQLDAFIIEEPSDDPRLDHVRLQPCFSPVWDTGIALYALTEAGCTAERSERIARVCDWLVDREVRRTGDWARNLRPQDRGLRVGPGAEGAAWAFEYKNEWYPDCDDTAMVAKALWRAGDRPGETRNRETARRAVRWLVAMQNDDGGWAAFDRTKDRPWMEKVPFADHNAMQDPSCADITGRVIEALVTCGLSPDSDAVRRGVSYVLARQEPEGCWWGRWGVNYIYGTWQALGGLRHAGVSADHPALRRALQWLRGVQNEDGGFGESANSYEDRSLMGRGPSTASQTAWALLSLLHLAPADDPACGRAARWLADHQLGRDKPPFAPARCAAPGATDPGTPDLSPTDFVRDRAGSWSEHYFTGTGFPRVFYLRYHLYRHYFPVLALARYENLRAKGR